MKLEVLVSTVNCDDPKKLVEKMNIQTDAIIINQCHKFEYKEFQNNHKTIKVFSFNERGIGLSRNSALMRASGDIVLFADDDEQFVDGYEKIILEAFEINKKADFIVFDIESFGNNERIYKKIKKDKRLHWYNCLKYGAVRFAVKLQKLRNCNISFSFFKAHVSEL